MLREKAKRIVIKVGSSSVTGESGRLDHDNIKSLVDQVADEKAKGTECLLVSSGAIAAGVESLGLPGKPETIAKMQAAAAVGQGLLVHEYSAFFRRHGIHVAQVLLTQFDMAHRELYLNARQAINEMLSMGAVPVINENDTTAVEEIKFGDNDTIAALVAVLVKADLLVILSDIDGLYDADPRRARGRRISRIDEITPEVEAMASGIGSRFGSGGMVTKLHAAKITGAAGIGLYIADGRETAVIKKIMDGAEVGTYFVPKKKRMGDRRLWIGYGRMIKGTVTVDDGAVKALVEEKRSLLPAGITSVKGKFAIGDTIEVANGDGKAVARGSTNYSAEELNKVKGKRSAQIAESFGADFDEEVIHRDFMVIL